MKVDYEGKRVLLIKFKKKELKKCLRIYADNKKVVDVNYEIINELVNIHGLALSLVIFDLVFSFNNFPNNNPLKDEVRFAELETNYFEVI